jgi:hypothetical protein
MIAVPGLIDMAKPPFKEVGKKSDLRQAFWYRRTFKLEGEIPAVAILKIHKARYGTKVFLNGKVVGEHLPCFMPGYLDLKRYLKGNGQANELIIRVGADRESLPQDMPTGWDFEKYLFIPGIYDSVELILTGSPYIANVQVVPKLLAGPAAGQVQVRLEIKLGAPATNLNQQLNVSLKVREAKSGKLVFARSERLDRKFSANSLDTLDTGWRLDEMTGGARLWTPDAPFLYELEIGIGADAVRTRLGIRDFHFDPETGRAILNRRPYFLRGSNVTVYRFFEDAERGDKPWRAEWVRRLHKKFKTMHWNALRYCIGFPPELWYDIADEEGFLIQDEFPIWLLGKAPENPRAEKIIPEYTEWMQERWNHPCVVIWDAQNESYTAETGKALQAVSSLDLSNRPWENGWGEPQSPTDCVEAHPYLFIRAWQGKEPFRLRDMAKVSGLPTLQKPQRKIKAPILINEYAWLWLTRDGQPTCLTDKVYASLLGPNSTIEQRRVLYAKYLAAKTEFWRCHRQCAGVLHFCGLGYSRSGDKPRPEGGATSDHFTDLEKLAFEPSFGKYVRDAFNPVGLMLDFWADEVEPSAKQQLKVFVINDLYQDWQGKVELRVLKGNKSLTAQSQSCTVPSLGREILSFPVTMPEEAGNYTLMAKLADRKGKPVRSLRDFQVKTEK